MYRTGKTAEAGCTRSMSAAGRTADYDPFDADLLLCAGTGQHFDSRLSDYAAVRPVDLKNFMP